MNYQPLLRNYRQMVRIIRNKDNSAINFSLGNAYGEKKNSFSNVFLNGDGITPTELQVRTLNEINIPSTSIRRPEAPAEKGTLSARESSSLFHDLNKPTQDYLNTANSDSATTRSEGQAGTKFRTELGKNSQLVKVLNQHHLSPQSTRLSKAGSENKQRHSSVPITKSHINQKTAMAPTQNTFAAF